jgi:ATP-binding cassette subfamily D (ALD) long-chain fatty acid import protein
MFRVIRKLWPLVEGTITMPEDKQIYFLTQVNFVPLGSLRDLVTYPLSFEQMRAEGRTDEEVMEVLKWAWVSPDVIEDGRAQLQFTIEGAVVRPKLDDLRDWQKDLSPGQKQKLAFARLFFHRPNFVVLDECTNGISPDVEQDLYNRCTALNLGIFSISHKIELKEFHDLELHYNGDINGTWGLHDCKDTMGRILK